MPRVRLTGSGQWRATALAVGVALLATACTSTGTSAAGGASGSAAASSSAPAASGSQVGSALCADVAAVRASVVKLTQVKLSQVTASTLTADVGDVTTNLTNLSNTANGQWSTQTAALKSAAASLQSSLQGVNTGSGSVVKAVATLGEVLASAESLLTTAHSSCPGIGGVR